MASVPVTLDGVLYDLYARTTQRVIFIGDASLSGLGVGGGPIIPPPGDVKPPEDKPPGIWGGPIDPYPGHPLPEPPKPPTGTPDSDGFIKPPPADGGWAYHKDYAWGYYPKPGQSGPK